MKRIILFIKRLFCTHKHKVEVVSWKGEYKCRSSKVSSKLYYTVWSHIECEYCRKELRLPEKIKVRLSFPALKVYLSQFGVNVKD